ncbi:hypothetical protein [Nocardia aurantia]|uniref:Uncharacterized protein n=1 Tax=Nocardia aurantia TaxID=2585199 RepID=A0A7K0DNI3_9NOCA|nr:hypothetical protein [Nocardia aurantia]MQY27300.1 hypothetical protein [Nocardia aurantia]
MANFPSGHFTITTNDTGRCLRTDLGATRVLHTGHRADTPDETTPAPSLELGDSDRATVTAWYLDTTYDRDHRAPRNQLVSVAAREQRNIGDYCVTLDSDSAPEEELPDRQARTHRRADLEHLMPSEWGQPGSKSVEVTRTWHDFCGPYTHELFHQWGENAEEMLLLICEDDPPAQWHGTDAQVLFDAVKAYHVESSQPLPKVTAADLHHRDTAITMDSCTADRATGVTYQWQTDGHYIWGADSTTIPSHRTYWTDNGSHGLVARRKGGTGQTWTCTPV